MYVLIEISLYFLFTIIIFCTQFAISFDVTYETKKKRKKKLRNGVASRQHNFSIYRTKVSAINDASML